MDTGMLVGVGPGVALLDAAEREEGVVVVAGVVAVADVVAVAAEEEVVVE
jgi:hypothetical protein